MFDIITIGDATLDTFIVLDDSSSSCHIYKHKTLLCLNYADKTPIEQSTQSVGGNAANVAAGTQKLGLKASIVTELGADITGHIVHDELEHAGVNTSLIKTIPGKEKQNSIVLNYQSERTILSYHAKRAYSLPRLPSTKWIYYTSLGKGFEKLQNKLTKHLDTHPSTKLAMNPGSYQFKKGLKKIRQLLKRANILFVNKEEAVRILDCRMKKPKSLIKDLHNKGVKTVVITDGSEGSYASNGEEMYKMDVYPDRPIAKTGAGDAYASGFLAAIHHNKSLPDAMRWGSANAVSVIQKFGAHHGLCTKSGIQKILKKYPNINPETL